jgi:hypothetical protein
MLNPIAFTAEEKVEPICLCAIGSVGSGCTCSGTTGVGPAPACPFPQPR